MLIKDIDVHDGLGIIHVAVSRTDYERLSLYLKECKRLVEENEILREEFEENEALREELRK